MKLNILTRGDLITSQIERIQPRQDTWNISAYGGNFLNELCIVHKSGIKKQMTAKTELI